MALRVAGASRSFTAPTSLDTSAGPARRDGALAFDQTTQQWLPVGAAALMRHPGRTIKPPSAPARYHDCSTTTGVTASGSSGNSVTVDGSSYLLQAFHPLGALKMTASTNAGGTTNYDIALSGSAWNFLQDTSRAGVGGDVHAPSHRWRLWLRTDDTLDQASTSVANVRVYVSSGDPTFTNAARMDLYTASSLGGEGVPIIHRNRWVPVPLLAHQQYYPAAIGGQRLWTTLGTGVDWSGITHVRFQIISKTPADTNYAYTKFNLWCGLIEQIPLPSHAVLTMHLDRAEPGAFSVIQGLFRKYGVTPTIWFQPQYFEDMDPTFQPGYGPTTLTMNPQDAQYLQDHFGWETGIYDFWAPFVEGLHNFGGGDSTHAAVPWSQRSKAMVQEGMERAIGAFAKYGLGGSDLWAGQVRKLTADGFTDLLGRYARYSRMCSGGQNPDYWPPDNPLRVNTRILSTSGDLGPSTTWQLECQRAVYGKEWLTALVHSTQPDAGQPTNGFTYSGMTYTQLKEVLDTAVAAGFDGSAGTIALTGQVLAGLA